VEDLKLQLSDERGVGGAPGDQQKVGSTASIPPSHTRPQPAAPGPTRHQVPFGEDDEQVIPVLSLQKIFSLDLSTATSLTMSSLSISLLLLLLFPSLLVHGVCLLWLTCFCSYPLFLSLLYSVVTLILCPLIRVTLLVPHLHVFMYTSMHSIVYRCFVACLLKTYLTTCACTTYRIPMSMLDA
jgi:hypothetical protein